MKESRQQAILSIIRESEVRTQEELARELRARGFEVTQATVSRDIRELGVVKVASKDGGYRYAAPPSPLPPDALGRAQRTFRDFVKDIAYSGSLLVIKTQPGSAMVVAAALDDLNLEGVAGTIAGDDAVLVVAKDGKPAPAPGAATELYEQFLEWRREP